MPLHMLLENPLASINDMILMMEEYPAALEHRRCVGSHHLPLHIECSNLCRSSIISKCIELYPEALVLGDWHWYLPIHTAIANHNATIDGLLILMESNPASLKYRCRSGYFPVQLECEDQRRPIIILKCIELNPRSLESAIQIIMKRINKRNFHMFSTALVAILSCYPMSLYDRPRDDVRCIGYYRRKILHSLPRHIFTSIHESDYRDLHWQARAAMMMLFSQINIQQLGM
jgi:hypothetical protein